LDPWIVEPRFDQREMLRLEGDQLDVHIHCGLLLLSHSIHLLDGRERRPSGGHSDVGEVRS